LLSTRREGFLRYRWRTASWVMQRAEIRSAGASQESLSRSCSQKREQAERDNKMIWNASLARVYLPCQAVHLLLLKQFLLVSSGNG
jgi:hypothetical protein